MLSLPPTSFVVQPVQSDGQCAAEKHCHPDTVLFKTEGTGQQVGKRNTNDDQSNERKNQQGHCVTCAAEDALYDKSDGKAGKDKCHPMIISADKIQHICMFGRFLEENRTNVIRENRQYSGTSKGNSQPEIHRYPQGLENNGRMVLTILFDAKD